MNDEQKIKVEIYRDCQRYVGECTEFATSDPYSTNVIGVYLDGIIAGRRNQNAEDIFIAIFMANKVTGMAMHTPPHSLFLSRMTANSAQRIAEKLFEIGHTATGVTGEVMAVQAFSKTWGSLTSSRSVLQTRTRMYRLGELQRPKNAQGFSRIAKQSDSDLVNRWMTEFHHEATPNDPIDDIAETTTRLIKAGSINLWVYNNAAVSLAGLRPPVLKVSRIGPVYTPPEFRGKGFASALTAATAQSALEQGAKHVILYTDLSNQISNSIYQKIGFVPDHDGEMIRFLQ